MTVPCRSDCKQTARDGIPTGSSSHSTEKWSYLRPERALSSGHPARRGRTATTTATPPARPRLRLRALPWPPKPSKRRPLTQPPREDEGRGSARRPASSSVLGLGATPAPPDHRVGCVAKTWLGPGARFKPHF